MFALAWTPLSAFSPLSRAEVEGCVFFLDARAPAAVVATDAAAVPAASASRADFAGKGLACVPTGAVDRTAVVFVDALPLPDWGALVETFSVALAFAIGTLTFTRTGKKDLAIQTGYCSTSLLAGLLSGEAFT
ncbi:MULTISPECIES: hypothetical protein [Cupriavidus]|uniref:Uncharacterized protein n=1 Tax=Cupriavidus malaysiensis TaxID=367825 RepID=A0ABN4TIV5_9BURK|nr:MULTISPECIES: hypothetical protein [Cupriavidus]AOZ07199.1 hypothetical protein BKK80_16260 [Cupriavidus malaysiensis]